MNYHLQVEYHYEGASQLKSDRLYGSRLSTRTALVLHRLQWH
ncbi:hypothetical protein [Merismopedia glauca]|nr:hypothetical protein [Merismopedia glauca]